MPILKSGLFSGNFAIPTGQKRGARACGGRDQKSLGRFRVAGGSTCKGSWWIGGERGGKEVAKIQFGFSKKSLSLSCLRKKSGNHDRVVVWVGVEDVPLVLGRVRSAELGEDKRLTKSGYLRRQRRRDRFAAAVGSRSKLGVASCSLSPCLSRTNILTPDATAHHSFPHSTT